MMHIRASAEVIPSIVEMCRTELWQALDCSTGEFLERSGAPDEGLTKWAEYRNRVVGDE